VGGGALSQKSEGVRGGGFAHETPRQNWQEEKHLKGKIDLCWEGLIWEMQALKGNGPDRHANLEEKGGRSEFGEAKEGRGKPGRKRERNFFCGEPDAMMLAVDNWEHPKKGGRRGIEERT